MNILLSRRSFHAGCRTAARGHVSAALVRIAVAAVTIGFAVPFAEAVPIRGRVNPAYSAWRARQESRRISEERRHSQGPAVKFQALPTEPERVVEGAIPSPILWYDDKPPSYREYYDDVTKPLQEKFDPREVEEYRQLPASRFQGDDFGTCWAHAAVGAMEMWLAEKRRETTSLSVRHMVNRNGRRDAGKDWGLDPEAWRGRGAWSTGETYQASIGYLLSWTGPVLEDQDPYWKDERLGEVNLGWQSPPCAPCYHVQQVRFVPGLQEPLLDYRPWKGQPAWEELNSVKRAILEFGGIYASMYEASRFLDKQTGAYNCTEKDKGTGHAVTLVGWDDNYPKENFRAGRQPNENGAFLVRDSSGIGPQDGYLWISYADKSFLRGDDGVAFPYLERPTNFSSIYQYDPLGLVCYWRPNTSRACWGANIFTATNDNPITAVGVYVAWPDEKVEISVYAGCKPNDPTSGDCRVEPFNLADRIRCRYPGYYTVRLPAPVEVRDGDLFSVVVKMTGNFETYPIEYRSSDDAYRTEDAQAGPGQSFFSTDGTSWSDLTVAAASQRVPYTDDYFGSTANFCCKAYAARSSGEEPRKLDSVAIEGVGDERYTPTRTVAPNVKPQEVQYVCTAEYDNGTIRDVTGRAEWTIVSGDDIATVEDGRVWISPDVTDPSIVTVKVSYAERGVERSATWPLWVAVMKPSTPSGVVASQGAEDDRFVEVSWNRVEDAECYDVYRVSSKDIKPAEDDYCGTVAGTRYRDTDKLFCAEDYWYFVRAQNAAGTSGFSEPTNGWRRYPCVKITATQGESPRYVELLWDKVPSGEHKSVPYYRLWRSNSRDGEYSPLEYWYDDQFRSWDYEVDKDVVYYYKIEIAKNESGDKSSMLSEPCFGYAATFPNAIELVGLLTVKSDITAKTINYGGRLVFPSGKISEEDGAFTFKRKHVDLNGGHWKDGSGVTMTTYGEMTVGTLIGKQAANVTITLNYNGKYSKDAYTPTPNSAQTVVKVLPILPSAPSELQAQATAEAVTLTWKACDDALSYVVSRAVGSEDADYNEVGSVSAGAAETLVFSDVDAQPGSLVYYRVCSSNETGRGDWSVAVRARRRLAAPTGVEATTNDATCVTVTWKPVDGATHYLVYRQGDNDVEPKLLGEVRRPGTTTYKDLESDVGAGYYYSVEAAVGAEKAATSERSEPAWGRRMPIYETGLEIEGPSYVRCGEIVKYRCRVNYNDGHSVEVHEPQVELKLSVDGAAPDHLEFYPQVQDESVGSFWILNASEVSLKANVEVWLGAVLTNSTNSVVSRMTANRRITLLEKDAMMAWGKAANVEVTTRWPFGDELDVDFSLETDSAETLVEATLTGYDEDRLVVRPAHAVVGSGAGGAGLTAGVHRLTWNVAKDYPGLNVNALRVELLTQPVYLGTVTALRATDGRYATGVRLSWDCSEEAASYAVWRRPGRDDGEWQEIARTRERAYIDMDAEPDERFDYCVEAVSAKGVRGEKSDVATGSRKPGSPRYLVLDFAAEPDVEADGTGLVPMEELDAEPVGGWTRERGWTSKYKTDKLVLRRIANGSFWMGTPTNEVGRYGNEDLHRVTLTRPFYLAVFELTFWQFYLITLNEADKYGYWKEYPRNWLSYDEVYGASTDDRTFLRVFRARTGLPMDLPSEAQWEYACRAGTSTAFNIGVDMAEGQEKNEDLKIPYSIHYRMVGEVNKPNAWGLYDMHGNEWEWCLDWYHRNLGSDEQVDPVMNEPAVDKGRVARGGWSEILRDYRSACRGNSFSNEGYGIRPCCSAPAQAQTTVTLVHLGGREVRYDTGPGGSFAIPAVPDEERAAGFAAWVEDGGGARYGDGATIPCVERETVLRAVQQAEEVRK